MPQVDIDHVAHLARLDLTPAEKARFAAQLQEMLAYVDQLAEVDVSGVEPTAHATPVTNVFRDDEPQPSLDAETLLRNAPETARGLFIVPKIVE